MESPEVSCTDLEPAIYAAAKQRWKEKVEELPLEATRLTEEQQAEFVKWYFVQLERSSVQNALRLWKRSPEERDALEAELTLYQRFYQGTLPEHPLDLKQLVEAVRIEERLYVRLSRLQTQYFGAMLAQAKAENCHRSLQRLRGERETNHYAMFEGLNVGSSFNRPSCGAAKPPASVREVAESSAPASPKGITIEELTQKFMDSKKHTQESTRKTYRTIVRVVTEQLGAMPASEFDYDKATEFLEDCKWLSPNLKKVFGKQSIREVIEINRSNEEFTRVRKKTLLNYLTNFSAILNFGVRRGFTSYNPLKDPEVRQVITSLPDDGKESVVYTIEELNRLFRAPLYTGCLDDERGVNRRGGARPRRGRFWMPLLSLFHGFRLNEVAQLYTEDVQCQDGIWHICIRAETDIPNLESTKRLKTKQSKRRVPVHPEVAKLGFLEYVEERRQDGTNHHLFTDSQFYAEKQNYSYIASKRYATFIRAALPDSEATFHSFRHTFRDALREAGVENVEIVEALGGWEVSGSRSAQGRYGKGPTLQRLYEEISKVRYEGIDLSHLYPWKKMKLLHKIES